MSFYSKYSRLLLTVGFIITLTVIFELTGIRSQITIPYIQELFSENLLLGSILFIALFCGANLAQVPGVFFLVASILALGQAKGFCLTITAAIISCAVSYFFIRLIGQDSLRAIDHKIAKKAFEKLDENPLLSNIFLRVFFQTAPPLNYSLALSRVSFKHYIGGAIIGLPIPIFIISFFIDIILNYYGLSPR